MWLVVRQRIVLGDGTLERASLLAKAQLDAAAQLRQLDARIRAAQEEATRRGLAPPAKDP